MIEQQWAAVDDYITNLLIRPDPVLDAALEASTAAGLPAINVSPCLGKLLMLLARLQGSNHLGNRHARWLQHHMAGASPSR
jgi:predicted O-methyltransferase YrrM